MGHGVTGFFCLELVNWKPKTCIDHQPSWPFFKQISTSNVPGKTNTNKANLEEAVQVQLWWMTPACLNFLSLLGIYYSIPTFWSFWDVSLKFVLPALPFSYQWLPSVWICKGRCHCHQSSLRKIKTTTALASCNYGGHEFWPRLRSPGNCFKISLQNGAKFSPCVLACNVIHGQMLQELSEKNMVNSWDFQHLRLLLTLPTFNMDIWKSSLWKRTSCSTSSSSLGFHVKLLNLASFFKHKLDHKWV